jgi:hypothetical protein
MSSSNITLTSSSELLQLQSTLRSLVASFGLAIFIIGIVGNACNILTFVGSEYYKHNVCALCIFSRSIVDLLILTFGLGTRILSQGFRTDLTSTSHVWCKLRVPIIYINTLSSYTILCLQSIDAFLVTSATVSCRQKSNVRTARYLMLGSLCLWVLEELPYLFFQELLVSADGHSSMCITTNSIYARYRTYFIYLILTTLVPIVVIILFDILTYRHIHLYSLQNRHRLLSVLGRQMTKMTLFHIAAVLLFQAPFAIAQSYFLAVGISKDSVRGAQEQIVQQFFNVLGYGIYAVLPRTFSLKLTRRMIACAFV